MGNVPVVHEVGTAFASAGDAITGNTEKARQRWDDYSKESVIGSAVMAKYHEDCGNYHKSLEYTKGMARASGKAMMGGGILNTLPVFQEADYCGKALGHFLAGEYKEGADAALDGCDKSIIGLHAQGKHAEAGKAWGSAGITVGIMAASVATGGAAASLGTAAAAAVGAATGAAGNVIEDVSQAAIKGDKIDAGSLIGNALFGASTGAVGGATSSNSTATVRRRILDSTIDTVSAKTAIDKAISDHINKKHVSDDSSDEE